MAGGLLLQMRLLALVLFQASCSFGASLDTTSTASGRPKIQVTNLPKEYKQASKVQDIAGLLEIGLKNDIAMNSGQQWTLAGIASTLRLQRSIFHYWDHINLGVVKNNVLHIAVVSPTGKPPNASAQRVHRMLLHVNNATGEETVDIPDSIFIMNTWDEPRCPVDQPELCKAPMLSLMKDWDPYTNTSKHSDILVPFFNHNCQITIDYPWELKKRQAFMRAGIQSSMADNNTRLGLMDLVSRQPSLKSIMDIGITSNRKTEMPIPLVPVVEMREHARWRYLLSTDGVTGTCRLCKLLGINSVIVKEASPWVEYYGRGLFADKHFFGFTLENVTKVITMLEAMPDKDLLQVIENCRQYQQTYTTHHAKVLYFSEAVRRYNSLYPAGLMKKFVASLDDDKLENVAYLLTRLDTWGDADPSDSTVEFNSASTDSIDGSYSRPDQRRAAREPFSGSSSGSSRAVGGGNGGADSKVLQGRKSRGSSRVENGEDTNRGSRQEAEQQSTLSTQSTVDEREGRNGRGVDTEPGGGAGVASTDGQSKPEHRRPSNLQLGSRSNADNNDSDNNNRDDANGGIGHGDRDVGADATTTIDDGVDNDKGGNAVGDGVGDDGDEAQQHAQHSRRHGRREQQHQQRRMHRKIRDLKRAGYHGES